jgi:predicted site-specific integrase-resolvase
VIVSETASGVNWSRKKFNATLDRVLEGIVSEVVVVHKDRLCRFGYELIAKIFDKFYVKLVVHSQDEDTEEPNRELEQDFMSLVTVFVAKNNGKRAAENRRVRKREAEQEEEEEPRRKKAKQQTSSRKGNSLSSVSNK